MKKTIAALCLFIICQTAIGQTCEEREQKLLSALGGVSAGFMYDSYTAIGAICDGYVHEGYSAEQANTLLDVQKRLTDNIHKMLKGLVDGNMLKAQNDKDYIVSFLGVLTGLKQQSQYFQDYLKDKSDPNKIKYDNQRKENWKTIARLMGLPDTTN
jgi:hypothetical protein